jgi:homopolymeric O-antigen transport system ATP-binding protein
MNPAIQFRNVSKKYALGLTRTSLPTVICHWSKGLFGRTSAKPQEVRFLWALREVSFEAEKGESIALIGPNGAGKTTILKLLANITKPTAGMLTRNGSLSALIELGAGFHPDLTGRENIYLNGTIMGLRRKQIEQHFDEIVAFSELDRFIDTPVKRYSSGMVVRLGFAIAACIEPNILLVDEVLAVGDASFSQKCLKRIQSLISNGTTIVFVSHNLYMVQSVCKKSLYLRNGQVKCAGETRQVIEAYERDLHEDRARRFEMQSISQLDLEPDLEITKVEVGGHQGSLADALLSNQAAQVRVHYNAYRDVGKANMSVFIKRSDGLTCCMIRTKLAGFELRLQRGTGIISVDLHPLQLISGRYFAEAWFLNESDSMAINPMAGRSDWFSVKGSTLSYEDSSGVFEPITEWTHQTTVRETGGLDSECDRLAGPLQA